MDYQTILLEQGTIARVKLNRPEKRNAMSMQMMTELIHAFRTLDQDDTCRVIILEGTGKGFCAGGDLGTMGVDASIMDHRENSRMMAKLLRTVMQCGKFVIAKIHGYAIAGGLGLALNCDLTVMTDNTKIGTPEILRALFPFMISAPISRCMPQKKMMELLFIGENIKPAEAVELGLVNYACPPEELDDLVMELSGKIARHSPAAIRLGKEAVYTQRDMDFSSALDYLAECLTTILQTNDAKEGIAAFLEKRDAVWTGK